MKIKKIETLHCDGGWRPWSFIKITTDQNIVGYSECTDSHGSPRGIAGCITDLEPLLIGKDPRPVERLYWDMYMATRQSPGGIIQKAIGGIENALLDIKAKSLNVPVYELFGGPVRDRVRVYWSHCGTTRARSWKIVGEPALRSLDDVARLGREVVQKGFTALKTNIIIPGEIPYVHMPGFGKPAGEPGLNIDKKTLKALESLISTFRKSVGDEIDIILDLNFNCKTEGYLQVARILEQFNILWLEIDTYDPKALLQIKESTKTPICSGENLYSAREFRPYFELHAMDVVSIDVLWNGFVQSKKISDMAEIYEMNITPHNYYSHLATFISANFCAVAPNLKILEVDIDDVPWKNELVTAVPEIKNGDMVLPKEPGWGADLNEEVLRAHPWPK
jgi:galactonate dehydratase